MERGPLEDSLCPPTRPQARRAVRSISVKFLNVFSLSLHLVVVAATTARIGVRTAIAIATPHLAMTIAGATIATSRPCMTATTIDIMMHELQDVRHLSLSQVDTTVEKPLSTTADLPSTLSILFWRHCMFVLSRFSFPQRRTAATVTMCPHLHQLPRFLPLNLKCPP